MKRFDKDVYIVTIAAALTLCGASLLTPISQAKADAPAVAAPTPTAPAVTMTNSTAMYDDGDGDELLEHWSDPKYIHEQRYQLGGMMLIFVLTAGVALRQKRNLRRQIRG
jgi:hypothetical protein